MTGKPITAIPHHRSFNVPFPWLGSKANMLDVILPNIPEHEHYVEPFCGTVIVYLHKPPAKLNTLNDIDENIVNFFRVLQDRDKTRELLRRLRYTPYAKAEYRKACLLLSSNRNIDDITRAWAFYVAQYMGMRKSYHADPAGRLFAYQKVIKRKTGRNYVSFTYKVRSLIEIANKMQKCQILHGDGVSLMKDLDAPNVFMFIDPPYLSTTVRSQSKIYATEYNDELHTKILDFVVNARSKIILASYPNEMYDRLLDFGWVRIDKMKQIVAGSYSAKQKRLSNRLESLYLNYQPPNPNVASCLVGTTPRLTS